MNYEKIRELIMAVGCILGGIMGLIYLVITYDIMSGNVFELGNNHYECIVIETNTKD